MKKTASTTDNINRNDAETSCVEENVDQRAIGEVGLDRTVPVSEWRKQQVVLERVLGYALPDQCLVLHLRGTREDKYGLDVHARLRILDPVLTNVKRSIFIPLLAMPTSFPNGSNHTQTLTSESPD